MYHFGSSNTSFTSHTFACDLDASSRRLGIAGSNTPPRGNASSAETVSLQSHTFVTADSCTRCKRIGSVSCDDVVPFRAGRFFLVAALIQCCIPFCRTCLKLSFSKHPMCIQPNECLWVNFFHATGTHISIPLTDGRFRATKLRERRATMSCDAPLKCSTHSSVSCRTKIMFWIC